MTFRKKTDFLDKPYYCITGDQDWVTDDCLEFYLQFLSCEGIIPTIFVTHETELIKKLKISGKTELGIHPNFRPGSTHGDSVEKVLDHMFEILPDASFSRSHSYSDSTIIIRSLRNRGIHNDSNLCLHFQPDIVPLKLGAGITRYPVFWEDDYHWDLEMNWDFEQYCEFLKTPGLKIFNFHPFSTALNIPDFAWYEKHKPYITTLTSDQIKKMRFHGKGTATFLSDIISFVKSSKQRFYTLGEIAEIYDLSEFHGISQQLCPGFQ